MRKTLRLSTDHALICCGYSFGDNHINNEIESALLDPSNKTTFIAFAREDHVGPGADDTAICPCLERWRAHKDFGSRIYVATDKALYRGDKRYTHSSKPALDWWSFAGMTRFLRTRDV
jgi:hypothetical protein